MKALYAKTSGVLLAILMMGLSGCGESEQASRVQEPVAFHADDECHVCGMVVLDFPGPKGQALEKAGVKKFCSTAEMIGWWQQPENRVLDVRLYVHDMAHGSWEQPDDAHLIDAKSAWYVAGTRLKGAMGAVLASFAGEAAARKLAAEQGGRVLRFEEIGQADLQPVNHAQHPPAEHAADTDPSVHADHAAH